MNNNNTPAEAAIVRKVTLRIVPFVFLLYIVAYLDRANIGYAALQMNKELALSSEAFGFISGIFFLGYFLFEVPSNILLNRFGARIWITRILISWGSLAALSAFVHNAEQLYVLRFLMGVAEAGFFPGIIVYLTSWFRAKELATTVSLFTAAIPVSYVIGAPLSTWVMDNVHWLGWSGWRWMLFLEGCPAVLLGVACFFLLVDRPADARWLSTDEKSWLSLELERDRRSRPNALKLGVMKIMSNPKVLYLAFIYFVYQCGSLGVGYWMPQIIRGFSDALTHTQIGLIAALPYIVATVSMILWSRHSDKHNERKLHAALPLAVAAGGLIGAAVLSNPFLSMGMICVALSGLYAFKSPFWALPTLFLAPTTAAVSVAVINSIGNLGGFAGPSLLGVVQGNSHNATHGLLFLSALLMIGCIMTLMMRTQLPDAPHPDAAPAR